MIMKTIKYIASSLVLGLGVLVWTAFNTHDDPPAVGDTAPDFTLVSNEGTEVTLSDYQGEWVVLYFYPKDFTSGCTIQARGFQRDMDQYIERGATILGVSVDDAETHASFCEKERLTFKLLADTKAAVSKAYGSVRGIAKIKMSARNTFIINPEGKVAEVFLGVNPTPHSEEVLAALDRLQAS
jgi:peroxiredoxin Q/BCP